MILWRGKRSRDDEPQPWNNGEYRSWEWVLTVTWTSIDLSLHYRMRDDAEFRPSMGGYYNATLTSHFALGGEHFWYDGPHCCF